MCQKLAELMKVQCDTPLIVDLLLLDEHRNNGNKFIK
jgi:hypothetical protein